MNYKMMMPILAAFFLTSNLGASITKTDDTFALGKIVAKNQEDTDKLVEAGILQSTFNREIKPHAQWEHPQSEWLGAKAIVWHPTIGERVYGVIIKKTGDSAEVLIGFDENNKPIIRNMVVAKVVHNTWIGRDERGSKSGRGFIYAMEKPENSRFFHSDTQKPFEKAKEQLIEKAKEKWHSQQPPSYEEAIKQ